MTTSVVLIEDDPDLSEIVRDVLVAAGMSVEVAHTGQEGTAAVNRTRPDVILLDLDLPDADGLELLPHLHPIAPVIVLTGRDGDEEIVTGLERGADDYVVKPFSPRVLVARIEAVTRRTLDDGVPNRIERGALVIDLDRRMAILDGTPLDLTRRELDLLAHLAARPGVVLSRDELLASVWRSSAEWQAIATVTEHVRRVRGKLGDERWIANVRGLGYRFEEVT